jgi:hypothetical protein
VAIPSSALQAVLPLPQEFRVGGRTHIDKHQVLQWFNEHKDYLKWVADEERFILVS